MKRTHHCQGESMTTDEPKPKKRVHFAEKEWEIIEESEAEPSEPIEDLPSKEDKETDWLKDVQSVEEALDEVEDGIEFEPFNLDEERKHGTFQEDGFYVENRVDRSEEFDAWLASDDSKPCSAAVMQNHERIQSALEAADKAQKMKNDELVQILERIVDSLLPRETVLSALKRVAKNKSSKSSSSVEMKEFEHLTESADALLSNGDTDAYSKRREEFVYELDSLKHKSSLNSADDMFAEDSDHEEDIKDSVNSPESTIKDQESSKRMKLDSANDSGHSNQPTAQTDFGSWPISELKRFLNEHKVDCTGIVEKQELIQKARELNEESTSYGAFQAPEGYVYDPISGYFYSAEHEMFYDGPTRCFYNPKTTKWYDEHWNQID